MTPGDRWVVRLPGMVTLLRVTITEVTDEDVRILTLIHAKDSTGSLYKKDRVTWVERITDGRKPGPPRPPEPDQVGPSVQRTLAQIQAEMRAREALTSGD